MEIHKLSRAYSKALNDISSDGLAMEALCRFEHTPTCE
jgi:hypothetical protein